MALPGTMTICQEAIASVSQGVESLNPKFLDASLNYNNPTSGSRLGPILDSTNGSTSGSIEGGGVGLSDLSSISLGEGSAERAFDEQGASGQRKQSLVCSTPGEQARVMALLVRQGLQDPHAWVGLVVPCNTLLAQVNHVLRRYNIPIAVSKIGLITTLLHAIWRAAAASWGLAELGALMRHPLVLKTYPIAEPMAQWIQLYSPEWPPTNGAGGGNPRWFRRLHAFVWKAGGELAQVIANSAHNGTAHCLIFWIDAHLKTLHALVPVSEWDSTLVVEKMLQERLGALPQLDGSAYGHWMLSWTLSVGQVADSGHPRVVCGNREDMSFVQPHRCIMAFSAQCQPFPWMPKSWSDYFAIPPLENAMALPELGQNGEIWVLRHHPTPTESCYQKWAPRILAHGPWIHHDRLVKGGDGLMKNPSLIRPYPPLTVLSISDLQRWKSDPEAFYQERVLKIKSSIISPQQIWGMAIHTLLHHFVQDFPVQNHYTPDQLHHGLRLLAGIFLPPMPWWKQPRINALLHEIAQMEYEQRQKGIQESVTEQSGKWTFSLPQGTVTLVARADRIDYLHDGTAHIIDYKTGAIPSFVSLERMESIQLPLEGLMVQQGAFGIARPVSKISWWSVHATRGSQMKTYPRCVEKLLAPYGILLPKWLNQALAGGYAEPMEII
jgi:RecB family exonuclease